MARIMALDYGQKRTGIAVTDPMQMIASPLTTISTYQAIPFLQKYTQKESISLFVIGWPLQLDGQEGRTTRLVASFMRMLKRYFPKIPIIPYDERFTSLLAQYGLLQLDLPKKKRQEKGRLDRISAAIILDSFMESKHTLALKM
ncbi:MAG: Holliday junction resolvase RuvX [Bacteroidota bacterium]